MPETSTEPVVLAIEQGRLLEGGSGGADGRLILVVRRLWASDLRSLDGSSRMRNASGPACWRQWPPALRARLTPRS